MDPSRRGRPARAECTRLRRALLQRTPNGWPLPAGRAWSTLAPPPTAAAGTSTNTGGRRLTAPHASARGRQLQPLVLAGSSSPGALGPALGPRRGPDAGGRRTSADPRSESPTLGDRCMKEGLECGDSEIGRAADADVPDACARADEDRRRVGKLRTAIEAEVDVARVGGDVTEGLLEPTGEGIRGRNRVVGVVDELTRARSRPENDVPGLEEELRDGRRECFEERAKLFRYPAQFCLLPSNVRVLPRHTRSGASGRRRSTTRC